MAEHAEPAGTSAPDAGAPVMTASLDTSVRQFIAEVGADPTRLLDVALAVQKRFGFVSAEAIALIAKGLGLHAVEVEDTVSFYAFLDRAPRGAFRIRLSKSPVSLMKGAGGIAAAFEAALGISTGETTPDGRFTLQWTNDIGMADQEPAALINSTVMTDLTEADIPGIIAALRKRPGGEDPFPVKPTVRQSHLLAGPLLAAPFTQGAAIRAALARSPDAVIEEITRSRLRGRGGAGFPTGMKWRFTRKSAGSDHIVVCNADEGEPGTFKDRVLLTDYADLVLDGMTVAGYALGAHQGIIYLRGEYTYLWEQLQANLQTRRATNLLGAGICGHTGFDFDIRIQLGAGAYICGEESSLLESLEGKRGAPRDRPPFPTEHGYLRQPTAIDNVETLACAARIIVNGADWFAGIGTKESTGSKLLSVAGDCARPGVYDVAFGITINELLDLVGAPDAAFVQNSGPSGQAVAPKDFGRQIAYEDLSTGGSTMIFNGGRDVIDIARQCMDFFVEESCGWCTPCRVGTTLLKQGMEKVVNGRATRADLQALEAMAGTVSRMSRCGLGQMAPNPVLTTMRDFPELYEARMRPELFVPTVSLQDALREAAAIRYPSQALVGA
jgi:[NiFe] hydrogenase diaphorase moiety large subunit